MIVAPIANTGRAATPAGTRDSTVIGVCGLIGVTGMLRDRCGSG
jgi:hypothetical protein